MQDLKQWRAEIKRAEHMAAKLEAMYAEQQTWEAHFGYFAADLQSAARTLRQGVKYQKTLLCGESRSAR